MGYGIQCFNSAGKLTLDTEYYSLSVLYQSYDCIFNASNLSYTFTIPGFDHTKVGNTALAIPLLGYTFLYNKIEYPAVGQVKVYGSNSYGCTLLVLIA
jgi:hypothetical protein